MPAPKLEKCANPDCAAEFKRLGSGRIYSARVSEPQRWGLPAHVRQKVVWLCAKCALSKEVRFDDEHHQVHLIERPRKFRRSA